jgi:hypothetical protein
MQSIIELGGARLLQIMHFSLPRLLALVYPEFNWTSNLKSKTSQGKKTQYLLKSMFKAMFPREGAINRFCNSVYM